MSETIVGSVGVQLVPSARGFAEKSRVLLQGLTAKVDLQLDDKLAAARIDEFTNQRRTATVNVNVDTGKARAELDGLRASSSVGGGGSGGGGFIGALAGGIALLGPALVPIGAAFAGIAGYAGLTAVAVKKTADTQKKINALLHTAATTTSKKTYDSAIGQAKALEATVGEPQRKLLVANEALRRSFSRLVGKVGPALFAPLIAGMNLLGRVLPKLAPLVLAVSHALVGLIAQVSKGVASGGFSDFLRYVIRTIPPTLQLLGSLASFVGNLFRGFAPAGMTMLNILTGIFNLLSRVPVDVLAPIAAGLVGLIAGPEFAAFAVLATSLEILYQKSSLFRAQLSAMGDVVRANLAPVIAQLSTTWQTQLLPALKQSGPALLDMIGKLVIIGSTILRYVLPPAIIMSGFIASRLIPAIVRLEQTRLNGLIAAFNALGHVAISVAQIVGKAVGYILSGFAAATNGFAHVLGALSHVPHMGWAKAAAADMRAAAGTAAALASAVNNIPTWHDITIAIHTQQTVSRNVVTVIPGLEPKTPSKPKPKPVPTPQIPSSFSIPSFGGGGGGGASGGRGGGRGSKSHGQSAKAQAKKEARQLLDTLTAAFKKGSTQVNAALQNIVSHVTDFPKKFRGPLRAVAAQFKTLTDHLTGLKSKMRDLATSISQAFMPSNLFGGTLSNLATGLSQGLTNVMNGLNAQKLLVAAGVPAAFVSALLSSGNGALASQLAANPTLALGFAQQFSQLTSLSNQLGTTAAAAQYNPQIDATNAQLVKLNAKVEHLATNIGHAVGHEINGSASKAKRRSRGGG